MSSPIVIFGEKIKLHNGINISNPSEDAIWLAATLPICDKPTDILLEAGSGSGIVSLCYLKRLEILGYKSNGLESSLPTIKAIDINPDAVSLTAKNAEINNLQDKLSSEQVDILQHNFITDKFQHSFANPPYHRIDKGFSSQNSTKQTAHGIYKDDVVGWTEKLLWLTSDGGTVTLINHINNKDILLDCAKNYHSRLIYLQSTLKKPAKKIILQIYKKSSVKSPVKLEEFSLKTYDQTIRKKILCDGETIWQFCTKIS